MNKMSSPVIEQDIEKIIDQNLPWERFSGCRIAVTGGAGFLGGYVVRVLLALHKNRKISQPIEVIALVRNVSRAKIIFSKELENDAKNFSLMEWDLNRIAVPELADVHYIFHIASQASPKFYGVDPVGTLLPNTVGTAALLEALKSSRDARGFFFVSSSEIYGAAIGELGERVYGLLDPCVPRSCYGESKRMGETMCVAWQEQHKIPTFIVRPFHTYGPGLTETDGRVFADFIFSAAYGKNIVMNSEGSARRAFCYVTDAIVGFFHVLFFGTPGFPYNVANPDSEISVAELAELLITIVPDKKISVERVRGVTAKGYLKSANNDVTPNVELLRSLGWRPIVPIENGFRRTISHVEHEKFANEISK